MSSYTVGLENCLCNIQARSKSPGILKKKIRSGKNSPVEAVSRVKNSSILEFSLVFFFKMSVCCFGYLNSVIGGFS